MGRIFGRLTGCLMAATLIFTSIPATVWAADETETMLLSTENETEEGELIADNADDCLVESDLGDEELIAEPEEESLLSEDEGSLDFTADGVTPDSGNEEGTNISWSLTADGTLTLTGTGATLDYNNSSGTAPTVSDRPWASYKTQVKKLVVGEGITRIGHRAFQSFSALESAEFPSTLKSIGQWAFQNCSALTDVNMPDGVSLETGAFRSAPVEMELNATENDIYKESIYYKNLCKVNLTGNYRDDCLAIAKSQIDYHEGNSEADYGGGNTSGNGDYSEYGRYLNSQGNAWCSEFASWCVRMSGLPTGRLNSSAGANANTFTKDTSAKYYDWSQTTWAGGSYTPRKGDIILWVWTGSEHYSDYDYSTSLSHTTIIDSVSESGSDVIFHVVHGNSGNSVAEGDFKVSGADGKYGTSGKVGYFVAPDYDSSITKQTVTFNPDGGTVTPTSKKAAKGGLYGPMPIPTKSGNDFLGWYTSDGKRINMYSPCSLTSAQTLTAHWEAGSGEPEEPEEPEITDVKPPVKYLRAGADESSIRLYNNSLPVKDLNEGVHSQLYTYKVKDTTYTAVYIWADSSNATITAGGDSLIGSTLYEKTAENTITDVIMDDSISVMEKTYLCQGMKKLSYARLSENLKELGGGCFHDCIMLSDITIPRSLERVGGADTFEFCTALKTVKFEDGIKKIPDYILEVSDAAGAASLESVEIPASVTEIGGRAFYRQKYLTTVTFKDPSKTKLAFIGSLAFSRTNLSGIALPTFGGTWKEGSFTNQPEIGSQVFGDIMNKGFEKLIIPEGVKVLGQLTGGSNNFFKEIYLPKSLLKERFSDSMASIDEMTSLEAIYYAGSESEFYDKYGRTKAELKEYNNKWVDKMVFGTGAPTQVTGISAEETTIVKYIDNVNEGDKETIDLTITPSGHLSTDYTVSVTGDNVVSAAVGKESAGVLKLDLTYHKTEGLAAVTVSGGAASLTINVIIKDKDQAEKPFTRVLSGSGRGYGDKIALDSATPDAQIFYVLDDRTDNSSLKSSGNIIWSDTSERFVSASSSILEYKKPIVIGADTSASMYRLHAVAVKKGLNVSDVMNKELDHPADNEYRWGSVSEEDRTDFSSASEVPDGLWAPKSQLEDPGLIYTGKAITIPNLRVYFGNRLLVLNRDYSLKYSANTNAGDSASITVKLKGNYTGSEVLKFKINPVKLNKSLLTYTRVNLYESVKNGVKSEQTPDLKPAQNGIKLKKGTDYTLKFQKEGSSELRESVCEAGVYAAVIIPTGNFSEEITLEKAVFVSGSDSVGIDKATVTGIKDQNIKDWKDKGYKVTPDFSVTYKDKGESHELKYDKDHPEASHYTYEYENNEVAGTATLIIMGTGNTVDGLTFTGMKSVNFKISGIAFNKNTVEHNAALTYTYTGKPIDPTDAEGFTLTCEGEKLVKDKDYKVLFKKAPVNAGKVSMVAEGIGRYQGSVTYSLTINKADLTSANVRVLDPEGKEWKAIDEKYPYSKKGVKPEFSVEFKRDDKWAALTSKDIKVKYVNNKAAAGYDDKNKNGKSIAPAIIITGTGNFTGSLNEYFTIDASEIGNLSINVPDLVKTNKAGKFESKPVITDADGTVLKAGKDYDITGYKYAEDVKVLEISGKGRKAKTEEVLRAKNTPVNKTDIIPGGAVIQVTVKGKGGYTGESGATFTVADHPIKDIKFELTGGPYIYTGNPVTPGKEDIRVSVKQGRNWSVIEDPEAAGRYFDITGYRNNVVQGKKAEILIKAKKGYAGNTVVKFKINPIKK